MASWEDGPEFAPVERPAAFTAPRVAELPVPSPEISPAAGAPAERPADFAQPTSPAPALASLVAPPPAQRDASQPFEVASMTLTSESSAWGAAHSSVLQPQGSAMAAGFDPTRPIVPTGGTPLASFPPPAGDAMPPASFAPPGGAPAPFATPGQAPAGYPPPGPYLPPGQSPPVAPGRAGFAATFAALTPGVVIGLAIGCFLPVVSLMTYLIAFAFSFRVRVAQPAIRYTFVVGVSLVGAIALISLLTADDFGGWWMTIGWWALFASWITLVLTAILAHRSVAEGNNGSSTQGPF
jgi:hypothetical protein